MDIIKGVVASIGWLPLVVAIAVLVLFVMFAIRQGGVAQFSYVPKAKLVSDGERAFYRVLVRAIGADSVIFTKVRVADVLAPRSGMSRSRWFKAFNRISAKHFDFVVCELDTLAPVFAIELDDRTHLAKASKKRDAVKDQAARSAGFLLIRIPAQRRYSVAAVRQTVAEHFPAAC